MQNSLIAFLVVFAVIAAANLIETTGLEATAYATAKVSDIKVTGTHLKMNIFSPNGDKASDEIKISVTIPCQSTGGRNRGIVAIRRLTAGSDCNNVNALGEVHYSYVTEKCFFGTCKFPIKDRKWPGKDLKGADSPNGFYCIQAGCGQELEVGFTAEKMKGVELNRNVYPPHESYKGEACGSTPECKKGHTLGAMSSCKKTVKQNYCMKGDTCIFKNEKKADCRFDGWKCNTGQGDYCCTKVVQEGLCKSAVPAP